MIGQTAASSVKTAGEAESCNFPTENIILTPNFVTLDENFPTEKNLPGAGEGGTAADCPLRRRHW